jgi:hypothetical protein
MIDNLAAVMAVLMIAAVLAGLATTVLLLRRGAGAAAWLALTGLVLMLGVLVVTLAVEVPIDNKISGWPCPRCRPTGRTHGPGGPGSTPCAPSCPSVRWPPQWGPH